MSEVTDTPLLGDERVAAGWRAAGPVRAQPAAPVPCAVRLRSQDAGADSPVPAPAGAGPRGPGLAAGGPGLRRRLCRSGPSVARGARAVRHGRVGPAGAGAGLNPGRFVQDVGVRLPDDGAFDNR
ncbi:hypothetical protein FQR65_LT17342 [Abscondita terminalis]|nr:hypothetical protein FQR65_LT17342 [Abscondita terminalis]